jgi:hypothetical protein
MKASELSAGLKRQYDEILRMRKGKHIKKEEFVERKNGIFAKMERVIARRGRSKIAPTATGGIEFAIAKTFTDGDVYAYVKPRYADKFRVSGWFTTQSDIEEGAPLQYLDFAVAAEKTYSKTFSKVYNILRSLLKMGSDDTPMVRSINVAHYAGVIGKRKFQSFRDGSMNCFLNPIIGFMEGKREEYKTAASIKKINDKINLARLLEKQYRESGVPEDHIEEICKKLSITARFHNMFSGTNIAYNEKARWALSFLNTRINHLDLGSIVLNTPPVIVSIDEWKERSLGVCVRDGLGKYPIIRTLEGAFSVMTRERELMDRQFEKYALGKYTIDACKYGELTDYIRSGYLVSSVPVVFRGGAVCNLDMVKAYAQFKACPYYNGFMGKVWRYCSGDFSLEFIKKHIGIYTFKIVGWKFDISLLSLMRKLGLRVSVAYTLPSVEISCLVDLGLEVSVVAGCWGSSFDMDFEGEFVSSGVFREWSGRLAMDHKEKVYRLEGTEDYAEHIKYENPLCEVGWRNGEVEVYVPKKVRPTLTHVAAFITSYTRINILLKMKSLGFGNICRVMLDGIYTSVPCVEDGLFKLKELKTHKDTGAGWYSKGNIPSFPVFDSVSGECALLGAGGTGKTYSVLTGSYHDVLYVSPTRYLGLKMAQSRGCKWTTLAKFVGAGYGEKVRTYLEEGYKCSVVLLDEGTMCSDVEVTECRRICSENGIMFLYAGDMEGSQWFQCRNGDGIVMSSLFDIRGMDKKVFDVDYRATCPLLRKFKVELRDFMRSIFTGERADCFVVEAWVKANVERTLFKDACAAFRVGDVWIAPTHKQSLDLLEAGVCSGWRRQYAGGGFSKGEILLEDVGGCEKRGSITTHSCQGLTLENSVFVSIERSFDYAMLYTAISRCCRMEQLKFVW